MLQDIIDYYGSNVNMKRVAIKSDGLKQSYTDKFNLHWYWSPLQQVNSVTYYKCFQSNSQNRPMTNPPKVRTVCTVHNRMGYMDICGILCAETVLPVAPFTNMV